MMKTLSLVLAASFASVALVSGALAAQQPAGQQPAGDAATKPAVAPTTTTVGMRVRIEELPLPGSQLRAKPVQDPQKAELILRVLNVFPHGSGFRYNFEITPLVAGNLDVRAHLERVDGSSTKDLPEIPVIVSAELPAAQLEPHELFSKPSVMVGGYRTWQIVLGVLWVIGLVLILFVRRRRVHDQLAAADDRPLTLADRLRPLMEGARSGDLDTRRRAELERLLVAYWRERRSLLDEKIGAAIVALRKDPEASPLFLQMEQWLHNPNPDDPVDINALLEPYRNAPDLGDANGGPALGAATARDSA